MSEQQMEGLPLGTRIKKLEKWLGEEVHFATVEPDNVYGVLDLNTVAIPDGYKRAEKDWFRPPLQDERYMSAITGLAPASSTLYAAGPRIDKRRIIVEPIKKTQHVLIAEYHISAECAERIKGLSCYDQMGAVSSYYPESCRVEERQV